MPQEPWTSRPGQRQPHRHRRVLPDDGRALAGDPDLRLVRRDCSGCGGTAIPSAAGSPRRHRARTHVDTARRPHACRRAGIDRYRPRYAPAFASTYSMLLINASCVNGLSCSQRPSGPGMRRTVPVACSSSRTIRNPAAAIWPRSRLTRDQLEQVVELPLALARRLDERVLVGRLLQGPRGVPGEELERRERDRAAGNEVQRHRDLEARQVRAGKRQVRRRRQVHPPARREHRARTRAGRAARPRRARSRHARARHRTSHPGTAGTCRPPRAKCRLRQPALAAEPHAGVLKPLGRIDADHQRAPLRPATAACRRRRSRRRGCVPSARPRRGRGTRSPWRCGNTRTARSRTRTGSGGRRAP